MSKKWGINSYVACSIHSDSSLFNVGDYLSAKAISMLYKIERNIWLPKDNSIILWNFIYWGWWMIRPNFSQREIFHHYSNIIWEHSIIWVWVNQDINSTLEYSNNDIQALKNWIYTAKEVSVRDNHTYKFIKDTIYNHHLERSISINPCPSYIYLANSNEHITKLEKKYQIWIVPSFWHTISYKKYVSDIGKFIRSLSKRYGVKNILILCHDLSDYEYCSENFKDINSVHIKEFQDIQTHYNSCENIVTTRAHGVIFAAAMWLACSYIYLADKIEYLYQYHYWESINVKTPLFDLGFHEKHLEKNIFPLKR